MRIKLPKRSFFKHAAFNPGNKTIGSSALGGMFFGTVFGVIVVPGLYYIFGTMAAGRKMIKDEEEGPLTEALVHQVDNFPQSTDSDEND